MDKNEVEAVVIRRFAKMVEEVGLETHVGRDSKISQLGLDSLDLIDTMMEIERETGIETDIRDQVDMDDEEFTIGMFVDVLNSERK